MFHRLCASLTIALCAALLLGATPAPQAVPAAQVAFLSGTAEARAADGTVRSLAEGDAVFAGETLSTGPVGYLDLDFADGGRMLLQPETVFRIDAFRYAPSTKTAATDPAPVAQAEQDNAFFSLLKGGFRAVSGLIGKARPEAYAVSTPAATIGIRGTEYEARICQGDCADAADMANGLYLAVDHGIVALRNERGEVRIRAGEFGFAADRRSRIQRLTARPRVFDQDRLPDRLDAPRLERLRKRYMLLRLIQRERLRDAREQRLDTAKSGSRRDLL